MPDTKSGGGGGERGAVQPRIQEFVMGGGFTRGAAMYVKLFQQGGGGGGGGGVQYVYGYIPKLGGGGQSAS